MASLTMHNETAYVLTAAMESHILLDAQEHFGEDIRAIRVQEGLERHAFNARTQEVRYAFSPTDFGLVPTLPDLPEPLQPPRERRTSCRAAVTDDAFVPASFEEQELAVEAEDPDPVVRSLESLEAGDDDDEEAEAVFAADADLFRLDEVTAGDDDEEDDEALFLDEEEDDEAYEDDER